MYDSEKENMPSDVWLHPVISEQLFADSYVMFLFSSWACYDNIENNSGINSKHIEMRVAVRVLISISPSDNFPKNIFL